MTSDGPFQNHLMFSFVLNAVSVLFLVIIQSEKPQADTETEFSNSGQDVYLAGLDICILGDMSLTYGGWAVESLLMHPVEYITEIKIQTGLISSRLRLCL